MKGISRQSAHWQQSGVVLLTLVIVIALTLSTYYLLSISRVDIDVENKVKTRKILTRAKQALIDYAVVNWTDDMENGKLGKLPCPDVSTINPEGQQDPTCGKAYANVTGYYPWRTLGTDVFKDSGGSCLFYAVSPAYKVSPVAALTPDSYGQLQIVDQAGAVIQGATPESRPVAIIIAAGHSLGSQARNHDATTLCGADYGNLIAYLDDDGVTDNAAIDPDAEDVIEKLVQSYAGSEEAANPLNDMLITITHDEIWAALDSTIKSAAFDKRMEKLTEAIALCFAEYGSHNGSHLPMPAAVDLNGGEYRKSSDYTDGSSFTSAYSGRLPYIVSNANARLVNGDEAEIFDNDYCDDIDLTVSASESNINFKDDSGDDKGAYFDLWSNWKDHFFYAISKANNPDVIVSSCSGSCIDVAGTEYAGIIFFSGLKQAGQLRYAPPFETDTKSDVANYLENGNAGFFPDNTGSQIYQPVGGTSNDHMFCIKSDMSGVVRC
ncbi:MAG: hypothetical protein IMF14_02780 [Proteobacteria bacterium]|nr:hypothetical protein [Pseudomonadota bacterium]